MSVKVESTTDTPEAVIAAQGGLVEEKVESKEETKKESASEKTEEKKEASESLKADESEKDESEETESDDDESQEEKPKKKSRGFKRRIDKLNARISEYERQLAEFKQAQLPKTEAPKPDQSSDGRPNPDDFNTISEYTEAITEWKLEQKEKSRELQAKEQKVKEEFETVQKEHNKRVSKYAKENPAFKEAIESALDVLGEDYRLSDALQSEMLSSDVSHLILEELSNDLDLLEELNSLPATRVAREIGKLEAKLSQSKESKPQETKKITQAQAPLKPVGSKSTGAFSKSPDEMDFKEYKKWREATT